MGKRCWFPCQSGQGASSGSSPLRKATFLPPPCARLPEQKMHSHFAYSNSQHSCLILFPIPQGIYKKTMTIITHDYCFWIPLFPRHGMVLVDINSVIGMTPCNVIVDRFICSAQWVSVQLLLIVLRTAKIIPKITEVLSIHRCFSFKVKLLCQGFQWVLINVLCFLPFGSQNKYFGLKAKNKCANLGWPDSSRQLGGSQGKNFPWLW